jgi:hypothetical protein
MNINLLYNHRYCNFCKEWKERSLFWKTRQKICRPCGKIRYNPPEKVRAYYHANKERINTRLKMQKRELKQEIINAYGGKCECCGETLLELLTIDHLGPRGTGTKHRIAVTGRKKNPIYMDLKLRGFPQDGYRLLCFNCNIAKGFYGYCPHERAR